MLFTAEHGDLGGFDAHLTDHFFFFSVSRVSIGTFPQKVLGNLFGGSITITTYIIAKVIIYYLWYWIQCIFAVKPDYVKYKKQRFSNRKYLLKMDFY